MLPFEIPPNALPPDEPIMATTPPTREEAIAGTRPFEKLETEACFPLLPF